MKIVKLKKEMLIGKDLEFTNSNNDLIEVSFLADTFAIILNGRCVKATKTLAPIENKLNFLINS
jgi:hypothetical protein